VIRREGAGPSESGALGPGLRLGKNAGVITWTRVMRRLVVITLAVLGLALPANANATLFFLFSQPNASPNDRVTVRTGGTPKTFTLKQRVKPFQRPVRLYLLRKDAAKQVRSRFDSRLNFIGSLVADKNGHGLVTFTVPPLDPNAYTVAAWCPGCAAYSRGRTFFVQDADQFVPRYRSQAVLNIETTQSCPVTLPNGNRPPGQPRSVPWYGNGLLWAGVAPDGVYAVSQDRVTPDGEIGDKLLWVTTPPWRPPTVSGERLDAPAPPLQVLGANEGSFSNATNPSFMTPVTFPTAGCWRLRAHVRDVSLTYVVDVVVRSSFESSRPSGPPGTAGDAAGPRIRDRAQPLIHSASATRPSEDTPEHWPIRAPSLSRVGLLVFGLLGNEGNSP
jgi:hypothetical protein